MTGPSGKGGLAPNNFDLLRLLASLQVLVNHSVWHLEINTPDWWWLINSFPGVPIFFVISGFLISASYERSTSLRSYARNRILRIYPGLWACVLVTIPVAMYFGFDFLNWSGLAWLPAQLVGLIYTPGFLDGFGFGSYNGSLWTIPIELQFYVLLPVIYLAFARSSRLTKYIVCLWLIFVGLAFIFRPMIVVDEGHPELLAMKLLRYSFIPHFYLFLLGVLLQRFQVYKSSLIQGKALFWLAGYVAGMYFIPGSWVKEVVYPLVLGLVVVSVAYSAIDLSRVLLRGNDLSYGTYIYHGLVLNVFVELRLFAYPYYAWGVALFTLVLAALSWNLVEKPFLRRKRQSIHGLKEASN
jgi:peptidoglycan/LPS O-acetylase OafA/YrhL